MIQAIALALQAGRAFMASRAASAAATSGQSFTSNIPGSPFFGGRAFSPQVGQQAPSGGTVGTLGNLQTSIGLIDSAFSKGAESIESFSASASRGNGALGGFYDAIKNNTGGLGKFLFTVAELPSKIADWGRALVDSQRSISIYSGTMSSAAMQLDSERLGRDVSRAQQTGDSFESLTRSQSSLEESLQPFNVAWTNAANWIQSAANSMAASVVEGVSNLPVVPALLEWLGSDRNTKSQDPLTNQIFQQVAEILRKDQKQPLAKLKP